MKFFPGQHDFVFVETQDSLGLGDNLVQLYSKSSFKLLVHLPRAELEKNVLGVTESKPKVSGACFN